MPTLDRIAEPWGTRTPYGPGESCPSGSIRIWPKG